MLSPVIFTPSLYPVFVKFKEFCVYLWTLCYDGVWFSLKDFEKLKVDDVEASAASESCDELSDDVFTKPLVLAKGK